MENRPIELPFIESASWVRGGNNSRHFSARVKITNGGSAEKWIFWGNNSSGQCCQPSIVQSIPFAKDGIVPSYQSPGFEVTNVAIGGQFTVFQGRPSTGDIRPRLFSCGSNNRGQLGLGIAGDTDVPREIQFPEIIRNDQDLTWDFNFAAGTDFAYASFYGSDRSLKLFGWGDNTYGQLDGGNTAANKHDLPILIDSGTAATYNNTRLGYGFGGYWKRISNSPTPSPTPTPTPTPVILNNSIYVLGYNNNIINSEDTIINPTFVVGNPNTNWSKLAVSDTPNGASFAINEIGELWACGINAMGVLGLGSMGNILGGLVRVGNDSDWSQISISYQTAIAKKTDNTIYGSGFNKDGQLGLGDVDPRNVFTKIGSSTWLEAKISKSGDCAAGIKTDGTLWIWGNHDIAGLTILDKTIPFQIGSDTDWEEVEPAKSRIYARKSDGTIWGFGINDLGQISLPPTSSIYPPIKLNNYTNWTQISAGGDFLLLLNDLGELYSQGFQANGVLGTGTSVGYFGLTRVDVFKHYKYIDAGLVTSAAIDTSDYLYQWGFVSGTNLSQNIYSTPQLSAPSRTYSEIAVSYAQAWALSKATSTPTPTPSIPNMLFGSGFNRFGQLGVGDLVDRSGLYPILDDHVKFTAANFTTSFIIKSNGTLWASGTNTAGLLGQGNYDNLTIK
jgi:alpha-tubulin suppressor-like RCC1 family protein